VRVVYLNPCGQIGGAEASLLDLLTSVRESEPEWELWLLLGEDGPLAARARDLGVRVSIAPFPAALARLGDSGSSPLAMLGAGSKAVLGTTLYLSRLKRALRSIKPDLIHTNGFKMHLIGVWARSNRTPVVWHIRDYVRSRFLMSRLLRLYAGRCAAVIANSQSVAQDVRRLCGERLEVHCVYNAVDLERFSPKGERADLDSMSGMKEAGQGTVRIGLIATLARWKGHGVFLQALSKLPADLRYRGYIVGGPIYQTENSQQSFDELRALAASFGIADKVGLTGFVREPADAMRALDIIVHASTQPEPFGRVIAEGMACGKAVVCSASGGAGELITEGCDALAHEPGDPAALANRIAELAASPELRARLGRAGRITAERRFQVGRLAKEIIPIYKRIVLRHTPASAAQLAALR
jgi:glycosyltransferase involved in cell wall biosynthesis